MSEKHKMNRFMIANVLDALSTQIGLSALPQIKEVGPMAKNLVETGDFQRMIIIKFCVAIIILGSYALSNTHKDQLNIRIDYVTEKTIDIGSIILYTVVAWNLLQIIIELS